MIRMIRELGRLVRAVMGFAWTLMFAALPAWWRSGSNWRSRWRWWRAIGTLHRVCGREQARRIVERCTWHTASHGLGVDELGRLLETAARREAARRREPASREAARAELRLMEGR